MVRDYFARWDAYRAAVSNDYIHHREAFAAMRSALVERGTIGSLLDLGCGDAAPVPDLVRGLGMTSYTGVDVTPEALDLARTTLAPLRADIDLVEGDFTVALPALPDRADVILCSLAMHHLPSRDQPGFFRAARQALAPAGLLLLYEPSCRPGEPRESYVDRQSAYFSHAFTRMTTEQVDLLNRHVADADFPSSPGDYAGMAIDAGFTGVAQLFRDPQEFWVALALHA